MAPVEKVMKPDNRTPEEILGIRSIKDRALQNGSDRYLVEYDNDEECWEIVSSIAHTDIAKSFEKSLRQDATSNTAGRNAQRNEAVDTKQREKTPASQQKPHTSPTEKAPETREANDDDGSGKRMRTQDTGDSQTTQGGAIFIHADFRAQSREVLQREALKDCAIVVDGQKVRAHRLVLSIVSDKFRQVFEEEGLFEVTVDGFPYAAVKTAIDFIYDGQISEDAVRGTDCSDLLRFASNYEIPLVTERNVLEMAKFAHSCSASPLLKACAQLLESSRKWIFKTDEWRSFLDAHTTLAGDLLGMW